MLPIIIKLLLSKLIKKKGAINQKTVHVRRTIVYQFMSQLNPETELKLFFDELLSTFDIKIDDDIFSKGDLLERLSQASFSSFLNFLGSFSVIIKQLGSLLTGNGYLQKVTKVFINILTLAKMFMSHLKMSIAEEAKVDAIEEEFKHDSKDALYRFVGHQSKVCMRKGLAIVKQLYDKYSHIPAYMREFSH